MRPSSAEFEALKTTSRPYGVTGSLRKTRARQSVSTGPFGPAITDFCRGGGLAALLPGHRHRDGPVDRGRDPRPAMIPFALMRPSAWCPGSRRVAANSNGAASPKPARVAFNGCPTSRTGTAGIARVSATGSRREGPAGWPSGDGWKRGVYKDRRVAHRVGQPWLWLGVVVDFCALNLPCRQACNPVVSFADTGRCRRRQVGKECLNFFRMQESWLGRRRRIGGVAKRFRYRARSGREKAQSSLSPKNRRFAPPTGFNRSRTRTRCAQPPNPCARLSSELPRNRAFPADAIPISARTHPSP